MKILGIETSCDETAAAVVDGSLVLSNVVHSQIADHAPYGGVVPEIASRRHVEHLPGVLSESLSRAGTDLRELDGIAVTAGPGLAGALLAGISAAKTLSIAADLPVIAVHHLEGHLASVFLGKAAAVRNGTGPVLVLLVSGGHTGLIRVQSPGRQRWLGRTLDDAAGEALDKGATLMGLGYPGGPAIEQASRSGVPCLPLPRAWLRESHDFSFSGLKTALWHLVHKGRVSVTDVAASFQLAVADVLVAKTIEAAKELKVEQILLSGGVAANKTLTQHFLANSPIPVIIPPPHLCTDNAAMVAACGYYHFKAGKMNAYDLDVVPSLGIG